MDPVVVGSGVAALLAVVAGLGVGRRVRKGAAKPNTRPLERSERAVVNVVAALGYDPAQVLIQLVQKPKPGIRILTRDGRPLRFVRASEIKRKQRDPEFRKRFAAARAM